LIRKIVVLSGGTAGYLLAVGLKARIPALEVKLIRLGDGEPEFNQSASLPLTKFLHGFLPLELRKFIEMARPVWTLGHKMMWGPRDHYFHPFTTQLDLRNPQLPRNNAFYVGDNIEFAGALTQMMAQDKVFYRMQSGQPAWSWDVGYQLDSSLLIHCLNTLGNAIGVQTLDDSLVEVKQDATGVTGLVMGSGTTETADLYIDASGPKSLLLGGALKEPFVSFKSSLPCDRVMLGSWPRTDQPMHAYSTVETMDAGWCWQLELQDRIERGYVYSSAHISDSQAEQEFRSENPDIAETRIQSFKSGRYERGWVKNVIAVGAAEGYVEPLHSTFLGVVAARCPLLAEILVEAGRTVPTAHVKLYNRHHTRVWDSVRRFLAVHYKYNTRLDTPFWTAARKDVELSGAETIIEYYRQCGPSSLWSPMVIDPVDLFGMGGYLMALMGQRVPTKLSYPIPSHEQAIWNADRDRSRGAADAALTVVQAMSLLPIKSQTVERTPLAGQVG
jgi:tryptophan halogenase